MKSHDYRCVGLPQLETSGRGICKMGTCLPLTPLPLQGLSSMSGFWPARAWPRDSHLSRLPALSCQSPFLKVCVTS